MDTFSGKKSKTGNDDIQPQRIIWAALIFTTIALISFAFSLTLPGMNQTWQVYLIISLTALALVMDVIGTALILRRKYTQGLKLLYWSLLLTVPPNALLVTNTTFILIAIVLIAGLVQVYYLQPREWRKFYQFGPIIASFFMMGFEIANPPFRLELVKSSTTSGNYGLLILSFLILSLLILAARLAWTGGLRNKLLVVLTGVIILLVTGTSIIDYINSQQEVKEDELQTMNFLYADYLSDVEALEESASALSVTLATRNDIKQLFLERDREGLIDLLTPMFETLRDEYDIRHLYIENLNGTVFVRIHNPANFGDDITYRPTAADALSTRRTVAGVDIGPNRIGVRSVSPMFVNGNFMGLLEVGLDYDQTYIDSVKAHTGADYTMWVSNAAAAPAGLKPAEGVIAPPISELFFYSSTSQNQFNIDKSVYQRVLHTGSSELQYVAIESGEFVVLVAPLLGYGDRIIGVLEISVSRTDTLATLQSDLNSEILIGLAFFLLGLALMWYTSQFILLRPLGNLTSVAQRQLEGDLTARAVITTKDELGQLGQTLNTVTAKLQETLQDLEGRVAARTKDLAIVAEVGTATSSILETDRLLQEVVDLTKERFSLYHSHIYMLDDAGENLVLAKGAGEPGRIMATEKRSIPMNSEQSLVARAARERKGVTINDVTLAPDFLPNPLLPNTRSEMAVPMLVGETLIGVFDIQSDVADRFTDSDINIQTTLASQLATSVQNARSFERSKAQADFESTLNAISQKIQRAGTIEDTLQTAIRELGTAIGASRVKANISAQKRGNNN